MNEENKKFVQDIMTKMSGVKHLAERNKNLTETKRDLRNKLHSMVRFLNEDVVGASTSSLIRTDVQIGPDEKDYNGRTYRSVLTINHHGFGTIKDGTDIYGSTMSRNLHTDEFMDHIFNKDIQTKLLVFLAKNNNKKMLAVCTELFSKIDILNTIKDISEKYGNDRASVQDFDAEVDIAVPSMLDDDYNTVANYKQIRVKTLVSEGSEKVFLFGAGATEEDLQKASQYSYSPDKVSVPSTCVNLSEMEGVMIMIQIVDELDKAFSDIHVRMDADVNKCASVEEQLNLEFSMYKLAKEFKNK